MQKERRKYLGEAYKDYFKTFKSRIVRVEERERKGWLSQTEIEEVTRPYVIGDICFRDNGYSETIFQPDGENWRVCALYDDKGSIIEWYFDITRKNAVDENGRPYCDDLYLDAALMPNGEIIVLDEDELKAALDEGSITQQDFELAYRVLGELREKKILDVGRMERLFAELRTLL